jgi:hypothetical protein
MDNIKPVLDTLTAAEWQFVQKMWDYYETFRPRVGEMEKLINGVEPEWVQARSLEVQTADGQTLQLRSSSVLVEWHLQLTLTVFTSKLYVQYLTLHAT